MRVGIIHTRGSACQCGESIRRGLEALGHESLLVNSGDVELHVLEMARVCEIVFDHTDS